MMGEIYFSLAEINILKKALKNLMLRMLLHHIFAGIQQDKNGLLIKLVEKKERLFHPKNIAPYVQVET